ncbi:MAG: hypothetical protein K5848_02755 [Lachnospiraceae bacterium]|nr:hypothetical protein [Lachnospiraceae bacterium]
MKKYVYIFTIFIVISLTAIACGSEGKNKKSVSVTGTKDNAESDKDDQVKEDKENAFVTLEPEEITTVPEEKLCEINKGEYEHVYIGITSGESGSMNIRIIENACAGERGIFYIDNADIPADIGVGEVVAVYFDGAADWNKGKPDDKGKVEGHANLGNNKVERIEGNSLEVEICGFDLINGASQSQKGIAGAADSRVFGLEISNNNDRSGSIVVPYEKGPESTWEAPLNEEQLAIKKAVGDRAIITFDRKTLDVISYRYPDSR